MRVASIAAIAGLALAVAAPAQEAAPSMPGWMAGAWQQVDGDRWTEEYWTAPRGGLMLGAGRSGRGEALREWEATRIQIGEDGKPAFIASPEGGSPTRFALVSAGPTEIVFANPAHDYPQRIRYWRDGAALMAEVALADGGKARQWRYVAIRH